MWKPNETQPVLTAEARSDIDVAQTRASQEGCKLWPGLAEQALASRDKTWQWPGLEDRFLPLPGFVWGSFTTDDGAQLRWGHQPVNPARAQCVLVGGFGEFIEKQFETIRDLAARGIEVWCLDWRGQGHSARPRHLPTRPRARNYERDAADLAAFATAKLTLSLPRLLVAHSMGGAIGLICMRQFPSLFAGAILCSPMLGLRTGKLPPMLLRCITMPLRVLGLGLCFIPGVRRWSQSCTPSPDRSRVSNDAKRCRVTHAWVSADPSLRLDGATFSWLDSALALIARIRKPTFLAIIRTPILLGTPEREFVVSTAAQRLAARLLQDCTLVELSESKHDPFLECDEIREEWLRRIDAFIAERFPLQSGSHFLMRGVRTGLVSVENANHLNQRSDGSAQDGMDIARDRRAIRSGNPPVSTNRSTVISSTIRLRRNHRSASA